MRILVTGGSGFIGTNLIADLLTDQHEVLNLDRIRPVNMEHYAYWKQVNILHEQELEAAMLKFDPEVIVHLAAVTDLNGTTLAYYDANIQGTQNVIGVAGKLPNLKKVIFTSSMYVCEPGKVPADYVTFEPHTVYGKSKVAGEKLVNAIGTASYDWVIVRPTSIWGPWFKEPYIDFFKVVYAGKYFDFGKACTKTYGYIGNTVFQLRKLIDAAGIHGRTFYLGDTVPVPISIWANEISLKMGKGQVKSLPFAAVQAAALVGDMLTKFKVKFPMTSFRLKNMMTDNVFNLDDLHQLTGADPYSRAEGIDATLSWLKKNKGYQLNSIANHISESQVVEQGIS